MEIEKKSFQYISRKNVQQNINVYFVFKRECKNNKERCAFATPDRLFYFVLCMYVVHLCLRNGRCYEFMDEVLCLSIKSLQHD